METRRSDRRRTQNRRYFNEETVNSRSAAFQIQDHNQEDIRNHSNYLLSPLNNLSASSNHFHEENNQNEDNQLYESDDNEVYESDDNEVYESDDNELSENNEMCGSDDENQELDDEQILNSLTDSIIFSESDREYSINSPETYSEPQQLQLFNQNIGSINTPREVENVKQVFELFFDDQIINLIVKHTNKKIDEKYTDSNSYRTNPEEIRTFIGVHILMGALNDSKQPLKYLYSKSLGRGIYRSAISRNRFEMLISCLRFDDSKFKWQT